jgi:hypothetical protein
MDRPKWIPESDQCLWCHRSSSLAEFKLSEDKTKVEAWYVCLNDKCIKPYNKFGMAYSGGFVDQFKNPTGEPEMTSSSD